MQIFYDTHAHLDFPDFQNDLNEVLERAWSAGITRIITIGTDFASSERAIALSGQFENVYAVVGWHPSHVTEAPADIRPRLRELARYPKVAAIGETGLDFYRLPSRSPEASAEDDASYKRRQTELFRQHLEVAAELGLNCVVHQRDSFEETAVELSRWASRVRGVFHCFTNPVTDLQRVLELGCLASFTGILTFKNAAVVRESLAAAPSDRFMLETDCPYLAPAPYRGKRCEPAYVREIAQVAAEVRKCPLDELSELTCATANQFFRF